MQDFADEVPGYIQNRQIVETLEALSLEPGQAAAGENLRRCYERLVEIGAVGAEELPLVECWWEEVRGTRYEV